MIVVGLTGGIATGKSTTADLFRERGIAVFDADRSVHHLLGVAGPAVAEICTVFGNEVLRENGSIDRNLLGQRVFRNEADRRKLEQILHPLVARDREAFLARQRQDDAQMVVLDVPLLFEAGADDLCDLVVVTTVEADIQRERALARDGMTGDKLTGILNSQMLLSEKVDRADFVLDTGTDLAATRQQLFLWLDQILD
jgi:dephospho-CoA kinase